MRVRLVIWIVVLIFGLVVSSPAWANHVRGIRIVLAALDAVTRLVTINIEGHADGPDQVGGTFGLGFDETHPAIRWGDGDEVDFDVLFFVDNAGPLGTARYRGAFTHTYLDTSPRTLESFTECCVGDQNEPNPK